MKILVLGTSGMLGSAMLRVVSENTDHEVRGTARSAAVKKYFASPLAVSALDDFTSHNTERLNVEQVKALLMKLDFIRDELNA